MPTNAELDRFLADVGLSVLGNPADHQDINDSVVIRSLALLIAFGVVRPGSIDWDNESADAIKEAIAESWENYSAWRDTEFPDE